MNPKQITALAVTVIAVTICFAAGIASSVTQFPGEQYPQTQYQNSGGFAVSSPGTYDNSSASTSMSPDHWGSSSQSYQSNPYAPTNGAPPAGGYQSTAFANGFNEAVAPDQQTVSASDYSPSATPWGQTPSRQERPGYSTNPYQPGSSAQYNELPDGQRTTNVFVTDTGPSAPADNTVPLPPSMSNPNASSPAGIIQDVPEIKIGGDNGTLQGFTVPDPQSYGTPGNESEGVAPSVDPSQVPLPQQYDSTSYLSAPPSSAETSFAPPVYQQPYIDAQSSGMVPHNGLPGATYQGTEYVDQSQSQSQSEIISGGEFAGGEFQGGVVQNGAPAASEFSGAEAVMPPPPNGSYAAPDSFAAPNSFNPNGTPVANGPPLAPGEVVTGSTGLPYPAAMMQTMAPAPGGGFQSRLAQTLSGGGYDSYAAYPGEMIYESGSAPMDRNPYGQESSGYNGGQIRTQQMGSGDQFLRTMGVSGSGYSGVQHPRGDLGFRSDAPTQRGFQPYDDGRQFDFENKKKEYPPMSEILATGIYYGLFELYYVQPHFSGNTAIATSAGVAEAFDFDNDLGFKFRAGFESQYGPGVDLNFFQFDQNSNLTSFTSDGAVTGTTSAWMVGANQWSRLTAANAGETLNAQHGLEVQTGGFAFFKELKFPISRLNGLFGLQYASIAHSLEANVTDAAGTVVNTLTSTSDMRAFGPRVGFEYFRPVGHTKLNLISNFGGALMFGNQDQFVQNSATGDLSRVGADEFITMFDFGLALQYRFMTGEKRFVSAKLGYNTQTWLGGGTAVLPQDDFGFRGFTFSVGVNR